MTNPNPLYQFRKAEKPTVPISYVATELKISQATDNYNENVKRDKSVKQSHFGTLWHIYKIYIDAYNEAKKGIFQRTITLPTKNGEKHTYYRFSSNGAALKIKLKQVSINVIDAHLERLQQADLIYIERLTGAYRIRKNGKTVTLIIGVRKDLLVEMSNESEQQKFIQKLNKSAISDYLEIDLGLKPKIIKKDRKGVQRRYYYNVLNNDKTDKPTFNVNTKLNVWYDHSTKQKGTMIDLISLRMLERNQTNSHQEKAG